MKIFNRRFLGNILIIAGIALFLVVVYDSIAPFFPRAPREGIFTWIEQLFKTDQTQGRKGHQDSSRRPSQPRVPPPLPRNAMRQGLLTLNVHNASGGYYLWAWKVKPEKKTGDHVKVEIAHAVPGEDGGFHIVAYGDRNGDGNPDKEIARSPFVVGEEAGKFSSFEFDTSDEVIFVGCAWPGKHRTRIYRGNGGWPGTDPDFDDRFFHVINGFESQSAGPGYTNMKVSFPD